MKRYDLMHQINTRGTYLTSKGLHPAPEGPRANPHVLMLSPPARHVATAGSGPMWPTPWPSSA